MKNSSVSPEHKGVLLLSGGMDSWITHWWLLEKGYSFVSLYVRLNHAYQEKELGALMRLRNYVDYTIYSPSFDIGKYEKPNSEIPQRNLLLSQVALLEFPDTEVVYLAIQKGETVNESNDRSPEFFEKASMILSHLYGRDIIVCSPILEMTKRELFIWFWNSSYPTFLKESLKFTTSCYHPKEHLCGRCSSCLRRYVATYPELEEEYSVDPVIGNFDRIKDWYIPEMLKSLKGNGRYDPQRAEEFFKFLENWVSEKGKEFSLYGEEIKRISGTMVE